MDKINSRAKIKSGQKEYWSKNENGEMQLDAFVQETQYVINSEPDFAKIYSNTWQELSQAGVSTSAIMIFVSIANHMEYCNKLELRNAQIIRLDSEERGSIMTECGISNEKVFYRHLKSLVDFGALRPALDENGKKRQGFYQVNPRYASKGRWHVKGQYAAYGICDLLQYWDDPNMHKMVLVSNQKNYRG